MRVAALRMDNIILLPVKPQSGKAKNLDLVESMLDRIVDKLTRAACESGGAIQGYRGRDNQEAQKRLKGVRAALKDLEPLISVVSWEIEKASQHGKLAITAGRNTEKMPLKIKSPKVVGL